jgi:hypothetical protein
MNRRKFYTEFRMGVARPCSADDFAITTADQLSNSASQEGSTDENGTHKSLDKRIRCEKDYRLSVKAGLPCLPFVLNLTCRLPP